MTRDEVQALFRNQRAALDRSTQRARAVVAEVTALLPAEAETKWPAIPPPRNQPPMRVSTAPQEVELWSPLPPSWNRVFEARAMPIGGGKFTAQVYKSAEAKEYAKAVAAGAAKAGVVMFPKGCMLRFSGVITMERAGCDLDDRLKVYFDALNGVVFEDDEQVAELSDVRRKVGKSPGIQAVFTPIPVDRYGDPL